MVEGKILEILACPRDGETLSEQPGALVCPDGHRYAVVEGVPVLLRDDVRQTGWWSERSLEKAAASLAGTLPDRSADTPNGVHSHVQEAISATCGHLYKHLIGKLQEYPIPELRLPEGNGKLLLDIGCNWGRWSIAAARKGYRVIGMDPNLDAVLTARHVAKESGVACEFVVGDARYLPFKLESFDVVFSYSVIQHLSKEDAKQALAHVGRVLRPGGFSFIQMPNRFGVRSLYHLAKRGFSEGSAFDVRYWSPNELQEAFTDAIGPSELSVDGFFGLGIQPSDRQFLPMHLRAVVNASEALRRLTMSVPLLRVAADSLYVTSHSGIAPRTQDVR